MDHYTTADELNFLLKLSYKDSAAFLQYADLVLRGVRRWDKCVDVGVVERKTLQLLARVQPLPTAGGQEDEQLSDLRKVG